MSKNPIVTINMNDGSVIKLELYPDVAPNTVKNFISLINAGYYNGLIFHRVISGFMIQGGCPKGIGTGGPGYTIEGEFAHNGIKNDLKHERGVISMARAMDPNSAGSQFFITTVPTEWLNGKHTIFGEVVSEKDLEVVKSLSNGDVMESVTVSGSGIDEFLNKHKNRISEWNKILGY